MPVRRVWLSEPAMNVIVTAARRAHPNETGGILAGVFAGGSPWITHASEIRSGSRGPTHYLLPRGSTGAAVDHLRLSDNRVGYLGDWHVHPVDCGLSTLDLATLARSSRNARAARERPLLLLVRCTNPTGIYELDVYESNEGQAVRCVVVVAGPLPPSDEVTWQTTARQSRSPHTSRSSRIQ
jgi:proteasome lid subunit RPN8/RPN11